MVDRTLTEIQVLVNSVCVSLFWFLCLSLFVLVPPPPISPSSFLFPPFPRRPDKPSTRYSIAFHADPVARQSLPVSVVLFRLILPPSTPNPLPIAVPTLNKADQNAGKNPEEFDGSSCAFREIEHDHL